MLELHFGRGEYIVNTNRDTATAYPDRRDEEDERLRTAPLVEDRAAELLRWAAALRDAGTGCALCHCGAGRRQALRRAPLAGAGTCPGYAARGENLLFPLPKI